MHVAYVPTNQDNEAFGKRLIAARQARKPDMSAPEVASALRIPYPTYKSHENGTRGAPKHMVQRYARFYRVDLRWLMYGDGTMDGAPEQQLFEELNEADKAEVRGFIEFLKSKRKIGKVG